MRPPETASKMLLLSLVSLLAAETAGECGKEVFREQ